MPRIQYEDCENLPPLIERSDSKIMSSPQRYEVPEKITIRTDGMMADFKRIVSSNMRIKPIYADCWLLGSTDDLDIISEYRLPGADVVIGTAIDGETEYNLTPDEYSSPDSINAIIERTIEEVRTSYRERGGRMDRRSVLSEARGILLGLSDTMEAVYGSNCLDLDKVIDGLCETVYRYTVGLGIFDLLLSDQRLEDIYIDAPCDKNRIHVTMSGVSGINSNQRCRTNLMVDRKEILNLISVLKRDSGLPFCESDPVLETDMKGHDARATVVGYPMSPNGDSVSVRKHSTRPWTLTRLIANGTIESETAGLLSFLVDNRCTFLICGARGAGKSSMLSALMFEFPMSQRILTIEDTTELPGEKMRKMGYKVQSLLINEKMDGNNISRADEALRVSLRMGESAIILGEVRGGEAKTLYQSMRTGRAGSSIMGTIHGDSANSVYKRVVHDMGIDPEAFMATDVIVTLGTIRDRRAGNQKRILKELVATTDSIGNFTDISIEDRLFSTPMMKRIASSCGMDQEEISNDIFARSEIRKMLAEKGNEDEQFLGPEWISIANDHVTRNSNKRAEDLISSFEVKMRRAAGE
ncbi:MAG TPA: type II/IV secretion system ATPase subunit [Candidatus Methanomethylophilaceae archaeon]|nr:type II/IV secretion system ATPase subunit [Candidatus Methanomethylophilaceae archaeon]